jgi:hypothetical protein
MTSPVCRPTEKEDLHNGGHHKGIKTGDGFFQPSDIRFHVQKSFEEIFRRSQRPAPSRIVPRTRAPSEHNRFL